MAEFLQAEGKTFCMSLESRLSSASLVLTWTRENSKWRTSEMLWSQLVERDWNSNPTSSKFDQCAERNKFFYTDIMMTVSSPSFGWGFDSFCPQMFRVNILKNLSNICIMWVELRIRAMGKGCPGFARSLPKSSYLSWNGVFFLCKDRNASFFASYSLNLG